MNEDNGEYARKTITQIHSIEMNKKMTAEKKGECYDHERISRKAERTTTEVIQSAFKNLNEQATNELLEIS